MESEDLKSSERQGFLLEAINLAQSYGVASSKSDQLKEYQNDFHMMQLTEIQKEIIYNILIILIQKDGDAKGQTSLKLKEMYIETNENFKSQIAKMILQEFVRKCERNTDDQIKTQIKNLRNMFKEDSTSLELLSTVENALS